MENKFTKQTEKRQTVNREGLPMSEKSFKEWQQAFIDIEESINALYKKAVKK